MPARPGLPAFVVALLLVAEVAALGLVFRTDGERVWFGSLPIGGVCAARRQWGLPCPTCGVSRSLVLAAHGRFGVAWPLSPVGPLAVVGLTAMSAALLAFAALAWRGRSRAASRLAAAIRTGALAYAAAGVVIWLASWVWAVSTAR